MLFAECGITKPLIVSELLTFPVCRHTVVSLIIAIYAAFLLFQVNKNVLQNPTFNSGMSGMHCLWLVRVGVRSVRKTNSAYECFNASETIDKAR